MTPHELKLFNDLHNSRLNDLKTFRKRQYKGIWNGVIDKYPESAHFIYELLQNADDAEASRVEIELLNDALIFRHNGKVRFTVTEEVQDTTVVLGHINSITSIGDSTKKEQNGNKIGKFGVGFKSVFQYTSVPEIYDDKFCFKIEDYIVPTLIDHDFKGRKDGETVFYFPFINPVKSRNEIMARLQNLDNPILFLSNIDEVRWTSRLSALPTTHFYKKELVYDRFKEDMFFDVLSLTTENGENTLFLFTRDVYIEGEGVHAVKVGYFYDKHKQKLVTEKRQNIFCFFPTKETFDTCYISHAPFKLVDSRQNIKEDEEVNEYLIEEITKLAADALPLIRDYGLETINKSIINENIWEIIPIEMSYRWYYNNIAKSSRTLEVFVDRIKNQKLFLTKSGSYICANNAVIPIPITIMDYFSDKQISNLINQDAFLLDKEVVTSISKDGNILDFARKYLNMIVLASVDIAKLITADFMASQDKKWILRFYAFLMNEASALWKPRGKSTENLPFRHAPIIPTSQGEWVPPYNNDTLNVYLPFSGNPTGLSFVSREYLDENRASKFFQELGIKEPDKKDYILSSILSMYEGDSCDCNFRKVIPYDEESDIDYDGLYNYDYDLDEYYEYDFSALDDHFMTIYDYYHSLNSRQEREEFKETVRKYYKLLTRGNNFISPVTVYSDEPLFVEYFGKNHPWLLDSDLYKNSKIKYGEEFYEFLGVLGILRRIDWSSRKIYSILGLSESQRKELSTNYSQTESKGTDYVLDGFSDALKNKRISESVSSLIWDSLDSYNLEELEYGIYEWKYYTWYSRKFTSSLASSVRDSRWMYGKDGNLYAPVHISLENFNEDLYSKSEKLIKFFGIVKAEKSITELGGTQEQQNVYELGKMVEKYGLSEERIKHMLELEEAENRKIAESQLAHAKKLHGSKPNDPKSQTGQCKEEVNEVPDSVASQIPLSDSLKTEWNERKQKSVGIPHGKQTKPCSETLPPPTSTVPEPNMHLDFGDSLSRPVSALNLRNNSRPVADAQKQLEKALRTSDLLDLLDSAPKYSYLWFKYLGEILFGDKSKESKREIEIKFSSSELCCGDKVFVVSNANTVVPKWIEFPDSLEIILVGDKTNIRLNASITSLDDTSAHLQIISASDDVIKCCRKCKSVILKAVSAQSIFNSLMTRFLQLDFDDEFDMNSNLPQNVEFIYGPPGTGKTTALVDRVEKILTSSNDAVKILILTPTNKAADVIARKMIDLPNCHDALSRFGITEDQRLIEEGVLRDRESFAFGDLPNNVVVTTAARYAYDGIVNDDYISICDVDWDYVIIDEASMIDLFTITYILYKSEPVQFIISGDPKQIQPTSDGELQPENIYQMVGLNGFKNAITSFERFKVIPLMTQYRSVATIGNLVSRFSYDGLISSENSHKKKELILDHIAVKSVNFLAFPVRDFDSLFGQTAVSGSAIHLYSAIFTYNFAKYISLQVAKSSPKTQFTVGIVSPYRKQADIVQQLIDGQDIDSVNCTVKCGTVHSFQGDECDIMILLLNSPSNLSAGCHALNENIINVGISRAKDYLFIVTSDTNDPKFFTRNNLGLLAQKDRADFHCLDLEPIIFGKKDFILNNTDIRCHLPVNVYSDSWAKYDVRLSDEAIDIQINS